MNPIILADNRFLDAIPTATDTATGFDVLNIRDLRPYTFWKGASAGTKYLSVVSSLDQLGANKITSWTNYAGVVYETFTSSGANIDSAINSSSSGRGWTNAVGLTPGRLCKIVVNLTLNSGTAPRIYTSSDGAASNGSINLIRLVAGTNTFYFIATNMDIYFGVYSGSGETCNFSATFTLYEMIGGVADTLGIIGHNLFTASALVSVESSNDNSTWTERLAPFTPASDRAFLKLLTSVQAPYWRLKIVTASVAAYIGVVMLGERITFPYPPDAPHVPYAESIEAESTRSRGGHLLGNVVRYKPIEMNPRFSTLTRSWVQQYYKPFWDTYASELKPFFYGWDLTVYPDDVFFAQMTEDATFEPPVSVLDYYDSLQLDMRGVKE